MLMLLKLSMLDCVTVFRRRRTEKREEAKMRDAKDRRLFQFVSDKKIWYYKLKITPQNYIYARF